jgi:mitogen-activated protein kinase 1/3
LTCEVPSDLADSSRSRKRFTVEECLTHPYLDAYHDPEDEPSAKPLDPDFFDFDMQEEAVDKDELKRLL